MNNNNLRKILSYLLVCALFIPSIAFSETSGDKSEAVPNIDLQDLALPSDMKEMTKKSGSVFYSTTSKNKPLMPVHFWGEVGSPGLHYIPVDSKLVKGISMAGGGSSSAKLDEVYVNRALNGKIEKLEFDLAGGGDGEAHNFTLRPGDTVFIEKDTWTQDRAYYTSLISVAATIITSIFILKRIEQMD